jgi:stearoyl-CoA desaturase (delta-9 desaturase)
MRYNSIQARLTQLIGYGALVALLMFGSWMWILISLVYYKLVVGLFGNQIAQHRYFSHRSFKTSKFIHNCLAVVSLTTGISPIVYASIHRHHHNHSDTENDVHSPKHGFIHSVFTWAWNIRVKNIKPAVDLMRDDVLMTLHENMYLYLTATTVVLAVIDWQIAVYVFLAGIGWNYLHMGLLRSALVHTRLPGSYRNFEVDDYSYNNKYLQLIDIGEGLHNNHHAYPNKYNQAYMPGEIDPAGWVINKFLI